MKYLKIPIEDLEKEILTLSDKAEKKWNNICDGETNEYALEMEILKSIVKKYGNN